MKSRNARGNTRDRWKRREWIRREFGLLGGELLCHHCRQPLAGEDWEVDRFPVCGHRGGRYVQGNIVPACMKCNHGRCNYPGCHKVNRNARWKRKARRLR